MKYRKRPRYQTSKAKPLTEIGLRLPKEYPWVVFRELKRDLDSLLTVEFSKTLDDVIRHRNVVKLLEVAESWGLQSISLMAWETTAEIAAVYQLSSLLKRYPFDTEKSVREDRAFQKFLDAEEVCKNFNQVNWLELANPSLESDVDVFTYARSFIHTVLGDAPDPITVTDWSRHGPGATLSTFGGNNSVYAKYTNWPYDVTKAAIGHARCLIENDERWIGALEDDYRTVMEIPKHTILNRRLFWENVFNVVDGNRVTFVPKDARTERTIAIEPTMNLMLQLGVDGYIRRRLKRFHVNLDDQTHNQELARIGSIDDSFATIDLKAASDSVSLKLCYLLLPPMWYDYLIDLRSPKGTLRDENFVYQKISSMGNGYTFALESLIFASIIYATIRQCSSVRWPSDDFAVYGDDLIVPTCYSSEVIRQLSRFGFVTNSEKTFVQGPIRESCGTDWFRGRQIRPVFITETPTDVKMLFSARNRIQRSLSLRYGLSSSASVSLFDKWIPERFRSFVGPLSDEEFDSYIHVSHPKGCIYRHGRWKFRRLVYKPLAFPGNKFLFRKLMNPLRQTNQSFLDYSRSKDRSLDFWKGLNGGGSCFTVTRRNRVTVSVSTSLTSIWSDEYLA